MNLNEATVISVYIFLLHEKVFPGVFCSRTFVTCFWNVLKLVENPSTIIKAHLPPLSYPLPGQAE